MRQRVWQVVKFLAVCQVVVFAVFAWNQLRRTDQERDLIIYYHAAQSVRGGHLPYIPNPDYGPDRKPFDYLYPPPFAAVIAPSGGLPWLVWSRAWLLMLMLAWWVYAACLVVLAGYPLRPLNLCLGGLALFLSPGSTYAVGLGQVDALLWCAFGLALVGLQSGKSGGRIGAGWLLGCATLVKIYSFWTLFALRERGSRVQVGTGALLALLIGIGVGALVCGLASYGTWAHLVLPVAGQGTFNADNVSLSMGVLRIARLVGWHYASGPLPPLAKAWLSAAAFLGPLGALWATRKTEETWRMALVGAAAAWCAPLCWTSYVPLALTALALWWKNASSQS